MKKHLKRILLIATLCVHHQPTYSSVYPHENINATTCVALFAAAIVVGSLYDVGKIYFKRNFLKPLGIQTEADAPAIRILLPQNLFTPPVDTPPVDTPPVGTSHDFREKKADKKKIMISNNGTITTPAQYANDQFLSSTGWNGTANPDSIKKLQSQYLNKDGNITTLPKVPKRFDVSR